MNDSGPRDRPAIGDTPAATDVALAALDAALAASPPPAQARLLRQARQALADAQQR